MGRNKQQDNDGWRVLDRVALPSEVAEAMDRELYERLERERQQEAQARILDAVPEPRDTRVKPPVSLLTWEEPFLDWEGPTLKVLSREDVEADAAGMEARSQDADAKKRKKAAHKLVGARGEYRKLAQLPEDWRQQLDALETVFPNFGEVIDYLRALFVIAALGDKTPRLDPVLLNGPPGVGKSLFAERISQFFGSGFRRINMETAQTNSQLAGSDEFWANAKSGVVFDSLVEGDWANPVFFVDEVDKAGQHVHYDPLAALYGLLEPGTAKSFRDQSMPGIRLDASRILWVLTSNATEPIPEPVLSRVRCFEVTSPTLEQAKSIACNIYAGLRIELHLTTLLEPLGEGVLDQLVCVSPRRQKQLMREAMGRVLLAKRTAITVPDLRLPHDAGQKSRRIGF